jgi:protein-S-isoprenylcysteine O-methyltransferase Ste14
MLGRVLFTYRSFVPVPIALVLVFVHYGATAASWVPAVGVLLVALGQGVRLWAVRHIGTISRTRANRYGPLISDGPYALVRNPLYIGNFCLWIGFVVWSRLLWMLPVAVAIFQFEYVAITGFEASLLREKYPEAYAQYAAAVPAWIPRLANLPDALASRGSHPWREVFFSERGTLIAVVVMAALLLLKGRAW